MNPITAQRAGLKPADREFLDISAAPRIKEPRNPSGKLLTEAQTKVMTPEQAAVMNGDVNSTGLLPGPTPAGYLPALPPAPAPVSQAPIPIPAAAPVQSSDSARVQARINSLYGQMKSAEERAVEAESRYAALMARLEGRFSPEPSGQPFFQASPVPSQPPSIPSPYPEPGSLQQHGEKPLTRAELLAVLNQHTQEVQKASLLASAQAASRVEAERDFPDVFADSQLRQHAELIRQRDYPNDPAGPYKAACMARGLALPVGGTMPGGGASSAILRKEALMGVGPSVPEGTGTPNDLNARYEAALAAYRATGHEEHLVHARLIQQGLIT